MSKWKKIITILNKCEDLLCGMLLLVIFLMGAYSLYDSYLVYRHANDDSVLQYKPNYEGEAPEKEMQGNMVAWLTMNDTGIDYPVMQGETNDEYVNKDIYGDFSLSGSIFLDSNNSPDFQDDYSLIYGHHMEGGYMFGPLENYLEETYYRQHRTGTLMVGDTTYNIEIFAVINAKATDREIFLPEETNKEELLQYVKDQAIIWDEPSMTEEKRLIGLSTCKSVESLERTVIVGLLT